jgi:hypothetical protein
MGPRPWREPLAPLVAQCGDPEAAALSLQALNLAAEQRGVVTDSGKPVRFIASRPGERVSAARYEHLIWEQGQVVTRLHGRAAIHDAFNALCWLAFPRVRARLNAAQIEALVHRGGSPGRAPETGARGRVRDQITLFDESGALIVSRNERLKRAWIAADWATLFVELREHWRDSACVLVIGHALHEKLLNPYKGICAHALWINADPRLALSALDAAAAERLAIGFDAAGPQAMGAERLRPMPLLGIPGWHPGNADPAFYRDPLVFRPPRH